MIYSLYLQTLYVLRFTGVSWLVYCGILTPLSHWIAEQLSKLPQPYEHRVQSGLRPDSGDLEPRFAATPSTVIYFLSS
jgi:hypothetical protein